MRTLVALVLVALAGCDSGGSSADFDTCDVSYSWPRDVYGESGLVLHATAPAVTFVQFEEMERIYRDVAMCAVPVPTPGPRVEFRSFEHMGLGGAWGVYAANGTVYVNTDERDVQRNCRSDAATLKHEYVHHVLYMNGRDWHHSSPAFEQCDALGAKVCDGKAC